ncbi:hypothetical protein DICVIV_09323 [Dictyocaulus viviparus]|uniref:Uncharacterized protein n=1 Tax=Dictyocaulus viviparus TaxID=29172 RepID=A0A0D8XJ25_DICVI|nr:hypothetical protein DICVIV_09323 [Dictyocaulus viviparus]
MKLINAAADKKLIRVDLNPTAGVADADRACTGPLEHSPSPSPHLACNFRGADELRYAWLTFPSLHAAFSSYSTIFTSNLLFNTFASFFSSFFLLRKAARGVGCAAALRGIRK